MQFREYKGACRGPYTFVYGTNRTQHMAQKSPARVQVRYKKDLLWSHVAHTLYTEKEHEELESTFERLATDSLFSFKHFDDPLLLFVEAVMSWSLFRCDKNVEKDASTMARAFDVTKLWLEVGNEPGKGLTITHFTAMTNLFDGYSESHIHQDAPFWDAITMTLTPGIITHLWQQEDLFLPDGRLHQPYPHVSKVLARASRKLLGLHQYTSPHWKRVLDTFPPETFGILPGIGRWYTGLHDASVFTSMIDSMAYPAYRLQGYYIDTLRYVIERSIPFMTDLVVFEDFRAGPIRCSLFYLFLASVCQLCYELPQEPENTTRDYEVFEIPADDDDVISKYEVAPSERAKNFAQTIIEALLEIVSDKLPRSFLEECSRRRERVCIGDTVYEYTARQIIEHVYPQGTFSAYIPSQNENDVHV